MKKIFKSSHPRSIPLITLLFLLVSCSSLLVDESQNRYDETIKDMKNTSWFYYGGDKRIRGVRFIMKDNIFKYSDQQIKKMKSDYFNKMLTWAKKSEVINNMKIKYIDYKNCEIFGEGAFNASDSMFTRYLIYDFQTSTTGTTVSVAIYNWRCLYPQNNNYRNYENEPQGNFAYTWPTIKSTISNILLSWENDVL